MMRIGSHLPAWFWRPVGRLVVAFLTTFPPRHMRQWQLNYAVMTGHRPSWNTTRRAFGRWVENMMCSLQLDHWSEKKIRSRVILENPEGWAGVHRAFQEGGLVAALPHMGSWDLVGAFACLDGLPVSSVAEALPDGQFEYFRSLRERLGFRIFSVRYRGVYNKLADDLDEGRVICLVADRDFSRRGLPVHWDTPDGPRDQTMPRPCIVGPTGTPSARRRGHVVRSAPSAACPGHRPHPRRIRGTGAGEGLPATC